VAAFGVAAVFGYAGARAPLRAEPKAAPAATQTRAASLERDARKALGKVSLAELTIMPEPHPLDAVAAPELRRWALEEPARLGSVVVGRPNRGALLNAVALPDGDGIRVVEPTRSFGAPAAIRSIRGAVAQVRKLFPDCAPLHVGDISKKRGGYLRPHRSHQSGLDADLGYYYLHDEKWYTVADADTLDRARTWALVKALIAQGNVEYIFMDRSVQVLLKLHALRSDEDPEWLDELFETSSNEQALIRHTWGHRTHLHVRFFDHVAEETGKRLGKLLRRAGKL
jgi:murein endopeptidase